MIDISRTEKVELDERAYENQKDAILKLVNKDQPIETDATANFMISSIASSIEQKILACQTFHCNGCLSVFDENEKLDSIDSRLLRHKPCISTFAICKHAEIFFKIYDIKESKPSFDFKVLFCLIFRSMDFTTLFPKSMFQCDINHKYHFLRCIVGQYVATRANQIAKQFTWERQNKIIRQQYNHLINFKGQ